MSGGSALVTASAIALALVFGVAGVAKLRDRDGAAATARGLGLPDALARLVGAMLPFLELAVAVLLLPAATRWWVALAALVLLAAFSAAIALALARGRTPECRCFGQLHASPVGWRTLARNGVLLALAVAVVVLGRGEPGSGPVAWGQGHDRGGWLVVGLAAALVTLVAAGGSAVLYVLRSYGRVLVRLETLERRLREAGFDLDELPPEPGLLRGAPAPAFWLPTPEGDRVSLDDLVRAERPLLLLFTSPTCGPCRSLMPDVARWQRELAEALTVAVVSEGDPELIRAEATEHGLDHVLLDESLAAYAAYEANGTPSAVLVATDGTVASPVASGAECIAGLVEDVLGGLGRPAGLPRGSDAPATELEQIGGGRSSVSALVDGPSVVLFWNPGCGFCRALHENVRAWEAERSDDAPALVVVSAGEPDEVGDEGFTSPVLLDPEWNVAGAFGADGTPMAVPLDASGRIAGPAVAGGDAVLALLEV